MSDYECPNCGGGSPKAAVERLGDNKCPWCGQLTGAYEP